MRHSTEAKSELAHLHLILPSDLPIFFTHQLGADSLHFLSLEGLLACMNRVVTSQMTMF